MKVIVDASTLISLARIGELHRLVRMEKELVAPSEDRSTAIRQLIKKALHDQRIELAAKRF